MTERARSEPAFDADEKDMLAGWLDFHRATLLMKIDGLSDDQLRSALVGSGTTLLGMVNHLAFAEDYWFGQIFAGTAPTYERVQPGDLVPDVTGDVIARYSASCERSRAIVASSSLDEHARGDVPNRRGPASQFTLRWILTHMIEETARHNGHADILREQLDGATGA